MKIQPYLIIAVAFLVSTHSFAQAPLTASDVETNVGVTFSFNNMQSGDAGTAGNDQLWDFSFLSSGNVQNYEIVEFGSTGNEDLFPNANTVFSTDFGEMYDYMSITEDSYSIVGNFVEGAFQISYSDPQDLIVFPAQLGVTFADSFASDYVIGTTEVFTEGEQDLEINGFGDITMPWGTVEGAYRLSGSFDRTNTLVSQGDTSHTFLNGTITRFFAPGFPGSVISVLQAVIYNPTTKLIQDIQSTSFISNFEPVSTDDLVVNDLQVFPNPASDQLTIDFEKRDAQPLQVDLLSVQGRVVQSAGQIGAGFGHYQSQMDVSKLPAGFYLLRLAAQSGTQTIKVAVD